MNPRFIQGAMAGFAIGALVALIIFTSVRKPNIPSEQEIQFMERIAPIVPQLQGKCK